MNLLPGRRRYIAYLVVGLGMALLAIELWTEYQRGSLPLWQASAFLGPVFLTVGWIVGAEINVSNARKQHTINIVLHYTDTSTYARHSRILARDLPNPDSVLPKEFFDQPSLDIIEAIDHRFDFYEFVAVALSRGDLDELLLRECIRPGVLMRVKQLDAYIKHTQKEHGKSVWANMLWLYERWSAGWVKRYLIPFSVLLILLVVLAVVWPQFFESIQRLYETTFSTLTQRS